MPGPHPTVAATRVAVRATLRRLSAEHPAGHPTGHSTGQDPPLVLVACSGGADSLALAAATAFEAPRAGLRAGAIIIDHGLQAGSEHVAQAAAQACATLLLEPVLVEQVQVATAGDGWGDGPEAAARDARYRALAQAARATGAVAVLLGHTRDDQAEQVLLGLARGSGARSLAGMPARRGHLWRPLLALDRATTLAACTHQGLSAWHDPHNADERYTRVRARRLLAELEQGLGPGVAAALTRTADLLRADDEALTDLAQRLLVELPERGPWPVAALLDAPPAIRARLLRLACARAGTGALGRVHIEAIDGLLRDAGRGPAALPGGWRVRRHAAHVDLEPPPSG
ncbi:tRNA(Ile)-lysidine synthase [Kineosphaera limosa]|nr:tRNA lysidine(34) synthetase TilS [Kineosphaera limosa]NYE01692.1 tRNA(Ile)-lysidine synthase [Kineosphaera limosa]